MTESSYAVNKARQLAEAKAAARFVPAGVTKVHVVTPAGTTTHTVAQPEKQTHNTADAVDWLQKLARVHIAAGGWQSANVHQKITAEGVLIVDAAGTDYGPWVGGTGTVTVSDGKLTVKNGSGASNNSICLIRITRL